MRDNTQIVSEDNEDMLGTYAMIDPQGMVYTNLHGCYHYSKKSAVEIGFSASWAQVMDGFSDIGFESREAIGIGRRTPLEEYYCRS